jgi:hypothetical protein
MGTPDLQAAAPADSTADRTVLTAAIAATAMVAAHAIGKATRDSLFLTHFPITQLPLAMTATSLLSGALVSALARGMTRFGPRAVAWRVFAVHAAALVFEWGLALRFERTAAVLVYLHTGSLGGAALSAFWSVVSECFDPHTAKRVVGRIASGAALGGALGGALAWVGSRVSSVPTMLLVMAALSALCAWGSRALARSPVVPRPSSSTAPPRSGFAALRDTPYLRLLALMVAGGALLQSLLDYALGAQAVATYGRGPALLSFFAVFQTAVGVLSVLCQTAGNRPALEKLGVGGTMALLPLGVAALGTVAVAAPSLATTAMQRAAEGVLRGSLFRSAYEVLFTPVPNSLKRATRALIDVTFDRAGLLLGSGLTLGLVAMWPQSGLRLVTFSTLVVAALELVIVYRLHRGYVDTLAARLRSGVLHLDLADIVDATTRTTASRTFSAMDRSALLAQIDATRMARQQSGAEQPERREPLEAGHDPALAAQLLQLLDADALAPDAMRALSPMTPRTLEAITGALLDEGMRPRARRRAARLLGAVASERSMRTLMQGLDARPLEVRYACGRALVEMRTRDSQLSFDAKSMFARATRELELRSEDPRSLEHAFDVLSLTVARETLKLAYGALQSHDVFLQGVALEYLDVALPAEVRTAMMPRLTAQRPAPAKGRPGGQPLEDLLRSQQQIRVRLDELRRARDPD